MQAATEFPSTSGTYVESDFEDLTRYWYAAEHQPRTFSRVKPAALARWQTKSQRSIARKLCGRFEKWIDPKRLDKKAQCDLDLLNKQTVRSYLEALDCPRALSVWLLYKYGEHHQLVDLPQPDAGAPPDVFQRSYLASEFLSKSVSLDIEEEMRVERASIKFLQAEAKCALTNRRLINVNQDPLFDSEMAQIIHRAWYWIAKIVGDGPSVEEFFYGANWGPGVTQSLKGDEANPANKYQSERTAGTKLWRLVAPLWKNYYPHWGIDQMSYCDVIDVVFVPKNAKTHRTIGIEPGLNIWFQKAIGRWLRRRLKTFGVDLDKGQTKHRLLAKLYSLNGRGVTVDFVSASDLIAQECVRLLLSVSSGTRKLLELMEICRTPLAKLGVSQHLDLDTGTLSGDRAFRLEKFSAMGNGYTFELESLIFYALALACTDQADLSAVSVYGDDVILPKDSFEAFSRGCDFFGFEINRKKTHLGGGFRESCGGHFHTGVDCKPYYHRRNITRETTYKVANGIRLVSARLHHRASRLRLRSTWKRLYKSVPEALRFVQPLNLASDEDSAFTDGAFLVCFSEIEKQLLSGVVEMAPWGLEGYATLVRTRVPVAKQEDGAGLYLHRLRLAGQSTDEPAQGNNVPVRRKTRVEVKSLLVPTWQDVPSWEAG